MSQRLHPHTKSFERAEMYLQEMHAAENLEDLAHAWELFLIYNRRTWQKARDWSKLQSKADKAVAPLWNTSQDDPLFKYCWEARNTDDHGLVPISKEISATMAVSGIMTIDGQITFNDGSLTIASGGSLTLPTGSTLEISSATVTALPVVDKYGKEWIPPAIAGKHPPTVLEIAAAAFMKLLELKKKTDGL
jgi:hypothetical protein